MINNIKLIRPPANISNRLDHFIEHYALYKYKRELDYHFNRGEWTVNLADTKRSMINYDFYDLVTDMTIVTEKNSNETNKDLQIRIKKETELMHNNLLNLYNEFHKYIFQQLQPIVQPMKYNDLFQLFQDTWGNAPFKLNYLLEDMFLLLGDKSIMQNVVGNSGSFKSTRTMIECNSLPSVLLVDDATVAGITRDSQMKGTTYLNNTVVYYNDVGDSAQMQQNFQDCLQSVYKKLFSEGAVKRSIGMKNSDKTLKLKLETPDGFKLKFNSIKPVFTEDEGQTTSRMMTINLPSFGEEEVVALVRSGRFGEAVFTKQDPRIFKNVLQVYYLTREPVDFDADFLEILTRRCVQDNNGVGNMHGVNNSFYQHKEMHKLYGKDLYKEKYYNRIMINTSMIDLELELYDVIREGLDIEPIETKIYAENILNEYEIAKTTSATVHKKKHNYNAFTVKAVKGIRRKFISKNETKISLLLKNMEDHELCAKIGTLGQYNVYVLLDKNNIKDQKLGVQ